MSEKKTTFDDLMEEFGEFTVYNESAEEKVEIDIDNESVLDMALPSLDNEDVSLQSEVEHLDNNFRLPIIDEIDNRCENKADYDNKDEAINNIDDGEESFNIDKTIENNYVETIEKVEPINEKPTEVQTAKDVIVTPDGRSLEDMLIHLRSPRNPIDQNLKEYKEKARAIEVNGKEHADKRYLKHTDRLKRQKKQIEGKKRGSRKYLQRNSYYSAEEKALMTSLGLKPKEFVDLMSSKSDLTQADKEKLIAMGVSGPDRYFKRKKFRTTPMDLDIIKYLAKFKFSNVRILSRLKLEPQSKTYRRLRRLKESGLVDELEMIGMGTIWFLTRAGMALSGYDFVHFKGKMPKTSTLPPVIGANHVAACLWNNTINILCDDDFPAVNRIVSKGGRLEKVVGENLVSELEIRSSLGKEANPDFGGVRGGAKNMYYAVGEKARAIWRQWKADGCPVDSPELEIGNEFLWILFPDSVLTRSFHIPDLVVVRDRDEDGSSNNIAIEVELNIKSKEKYRETLMAYKLDECIYNKVIWVTNNTSIAKSLNSVAEELGLGDKFDVVPMINESGFYKNRDIWHI